MYMEASHTPQNYRIEGFKEGSQLGSQYAERRQSLSDSGFNFFKTD